MTFIHAPTIKACEGSSATGRLTRVRFPRDVPTLTDGDVTLRAHRPEDAEGSWEQCQDPLSQEWTTVPVPYSREDARRFVTQAMPGGWESGQEWGFAVEATDEQGRARYGGTVSLRVQGSDRAEIAYGSHPWVRGRGVMQRALTLLLDWGFEKQGLKTVVWWADKGNWASRRLAWRLGFTHDGEVAQWQPHRGELRDGWIGHLRAQDSRDPKTDWLHVPRIIGRQVVLRPTSLEDADRVMEYGQDERAAYWLEGMPQPYTRQDALDYLHSRIEQQAGGTGVTWAVADPATDELMGTISLFDLKPGREAEIGYVAHPAFRGRGLMTEACALVVRHGFVPAEDGGLGLQRIVVFAGEENSASRRVIERNGFTATGRERRGTKLRDGRLVDTIAYDMLVEEWSPTPAVH
jgi:RimJ/RimL family protein N-acetyltransferase